MSRKIRILAAAVAISVASAVTSTLSAAAAQPRATLGRPEDVRGAWSRRMQRGSRDWGLGAC